jgi:hypothetical protein
MFVASFCSYIDSGSPKVGIFSHVVKIGGKEVHVISLFGYYSLTLHFIVSCSPNSQVLSQVGNVCCSIMFFPIAASTVISHKQKATLNEAYKKKKLLPLNLRPKKTRTIRRRLTKIQVHLQSCSLRGKSVFVSCSLCG